MTTELAVFLAFIALFTVAIVAFAVVQGRQLAAREEELTRGASARGWKSESLRQGAYKVQRFHGDTDGVEWTAESLRRMSGGHADNRRSRLKIARWHGRWSPGVNAPIVCFALPKGTEAPEFPKAPDGDGFFARMAQKAAGLGFDRALDDLFGDEAGADVDAGKLRPVDTGLPGFIVMAENEDEAKRVLSDGLERALRDVPNEAGSLLAQDNPLSVLIRSKGISLARMEQIQTINELEQFIKTGVGLGRAFKFGRRA